MSVFLHGGGIDDALTAPLERFVAEARARGEGEIAVIVAADGGEVAGFQRAFLERLTTLGAAVREVIVEISEDGAPTREIDLAEVSTATGIVVVGGTVPHFHTVLEPIFHDLRRLVSEGVPYFGSSAGAMLAATQAIVGGWQIGGVQVLRPMWGEGLDEVELRDGIGLIDVTIDSHAVEQGMLTRAIASVEAGLTDAILAIDEHATLVIAEGALEILGTGSVWRVLSGAEGVSVRSDRAA
ncbi:Type 1 glutamine amidotransferase-like domain-containing protein [Pseudoclavibacter alba]|uniref:Type 1 glutamine amidotransferase-like domain-containing protein n=1 Tax=Pseudoclavibacter albus TaxID=272241 RepID=A0ABT2HVN7_9MICO|nr:Type 1 glutamine amidotransferase-like domain-containing protein [Pseudoclavibacter alba]MBN6777737.1 Type 1 glutamine amidotransferase-like domain-containing protein [Pseudoclavibacter alba]MCT2042226.1 Type 1 glutamine amidotransferase-like domain-containing protein [Pseudoclavibacter alba]